MLQSMKDVVIQVIGRSGAVKSITRPKGKKGTRKRARQAAWIGLYRVLLFYAHCRLCVRHPGIRIFTRSNWKLHFSPMTPVFPYSLLLSLFFFTTPLVSFRSPVFLFCIRRSFHRENSPLALSFYRSTPFFAARHCFSQSQSFSFDAFFQLFPLFLKFLSRLAALLPILIPFSPISVLPLSSPWNSLDIS